MVFSFHCVGTQFSGAMACSAFLEFRELSDPESHYDFDGPHQVSDDIFQFTYLDELDATKKSFGRWLSSTLTIALEHWRKQL